MTVSLRNTPLLVAAATGLSQSVTGSYNGTTTVAKDLLVAVYQYEATTSGVLGTAPGGWTLSAIQRNDASGTHVITAVYTKVAAGSDGTPTFTATLTGTAARCDSQVTIYDFYDSGGGTPQLFTAGVATATSGTIAPVTMGQVPAGSYAIAAATAYGSVAVTWTTPGSWTSRGTSTGGSTYDSYANYSYSAPPSGALLTCSIAHSAGTTTYQSAFVLVVAPPAPVSHVNLLPVTGTSAGTAITLTIPAGTGVQAGDLLVVNTVCNGTHVVNGVVVYDSVNGSGKPYTTLGESQQSGSSSYYQDSKYYPTTVAIADLSTLTVTPFASATAAAAVLDIFRGCNGLIDKAETGTTGSTTASTSIACPALGSNATAGALVVSLATGGGAYTLVQSTMTTGTVNSTTRNAGIAYQLSASGSSTYADTWTQGTSSSWAGQTVSFAAGVNAAGSAALPLQTLAGTADAELFATGSAALPVQSLAGTGTVTAGGGGNTSTGSIALPRQGLAGTATETSKATGSVALKHPGLAGTATETSKATGSVALRHPGLAGTATEISKATGSVALPRPGLSGSGGTGALTSSTGSAALPRPALHGTATETTTTAGTLALHRLALAGTGTQSLAVTGSLTMRVFALAGTATGGGAATPADSTAAVTPGGASTAVTAPPEASQATTVPATASTAAVTHQATSTPAVTTTN